MTCVRLRRDATPADMLAIQLDDRAQFLARWRDLALQLVDADAQRGQPRRQEFARLLSHWEGRAQSRIRSSYRLVRAFRDRTEAAVWDSILQALGLGDGRRAAAGAFRRTAVDPRDAFNRCTCCRRSTPAGANSCSRRWIRCSRKKKKPVRSWPAAPGARHSPVRVRHPLSQCAAVSLAPARHARSRAARRSRHAASAGRRFRRIRTLCGHAGPGSARAICTSPAGRADIRFHLIIGRDSRNGQQGQPLPFLPGAAQHRLVLSPR